MKTLTINEYLKQNPDASLMEYKVYCENNDIENIERRANIEKLYNNWVAEQDGKYFFIDFNGNSRVLYKYSHKKNGNNPKALSFYRDAEKTYVKVEKLRMNHLWLDDLNPFYPEYKKTFNYFRDNNNKKIIEVNEEVAKELFARFDNEVNTFINDIEKMF